MNQTYRSLNALMAQSKSCQFGVNTKIELKNIKTMVRRGGRIGSWWGNRRGRDHWGDLGADGWIILGWISRRWDVGMWTGLGWPRIG